MRARFAIPLVVLASLVVLLVWYFERLRPADKPPTAVTSSTPVVTSGTSPVEQAENAPTSVYAHNLMLRHGPNFRVYVRWLRGQMTRAHATVNPSFDDLESFFLDIKTGVLRANIGDIGNFLNVSGMKNSPLKNIIVSGDGNQIKIRGTLHKIVPLPIEIVGNLSVASGNRIQIHVTKINLLKVPFKALLGDFHITLADLFHPQGTPGIQVSGNDIVLDPTRLLPPPHIRGQLTSVRIVNPDLEEIYGNAQGDVTRVEQWRNFIRLRDGTIDFGKLTMRHVDLIMIDISNDAWFDLDLATYQQQLVNGYTRMTPEAGLQIFMPDLDAVARLKANQSISIEWLKNRNAPPPPDVTSK